MVKVSPHAGVLPWLLSAALWMAPGCHLIYPFDPSSGLVDGSIVDGGAADGAGDAAQTDAARDQASEDRAGDSPRADLSSEEGPPAPDLSTGPDTGGAKVFKWARAGGGSTYSDEGFDVVVTSSGAVCVTGVFYLTIDLGGAALTSKGSADIFLACYDAGGKHLWSKAFGGSGYDQGRALATSGTRLCLAATVSGAVDFGGGLISGFGGSDVGAACFDLGGKHLWSRILGDGSTQQPRGISVDSAGKTTVTGFFHNSIVLDKKALLSKGKADVFLVQLDGSGNHLWSKVHGGLEDDYGRAVATTSSGGVVVTGDFEKTINLGGVSHTSMGWSDVFVAGYDAAGVNAWSKSFKGSGIDIGHDVAVSSAGLIYVTGSFGGSITFGGKAHNAQGTSDAFVVSLTSAAVSWSRSVGGAAADVGHSVAVANSRVHVTGSFHSSVTLGSYSHTNKGQNDVLLVSHSATGAAQALHGFGGAGPDRAFGIAADAAGVVYLTGSFSNTVDFGGGPVTAAGLGDIFLLAITP